MSQEESLERLVGQVLGARYRIGERLGEGAMGTVFRAEHVKVGRKLAVKVLHPRMLANEKYRRRFDREAELAGRLHHPNVAGVLDVGITPEGLRYLVMEYADGATLSEVIQRGVMDGGRVLRIVRQLCEGLHHAHEQGLIHRDFKPDNVIIERDDHGDETPRILDFGIAIALADFTSGERQRLTTEGMVLGTPHYMAPEHASGQAIDHRIDLFALGVICYEMLCGQLPFEGSGVDIARAYLSKPIPAMHQRAPLVDVDPLLEAFTRALLARSPNARPPTAKAAGTLLDLIARDRAAAAQKLDVKSAAQRRTLPVSPAPPPGRSPAGTRPPPAIAGGGWMNLPTEKMRSPDPEATPLVPVQIVEPASEPVPMRVAAVDSVPVAVEQEPPALAAAPALATAPAEGTAPYPQFAPAAPFPPMTPAPRAAPSQAYLATEVIRPIQRRGATSRRRPMWIAAALVGAGLGAMVFATMRGGESPARPAAVSVTAQVHAPAEPPPPPPPPAVAPAAAVTVDPAPAAAAPAIEPEPAPVLSPPAITDPAPAPGRARPASRRAAPAAPAVATPVAQTPSETPRVAPESALVAELYGEIGRALKRLGETHGQEATYDLWPRFRHIHIFEALRTPTSRGAAHDTLRYLEGEIARRSQ